MDGRSLRYVALISIFLALSFTAIEAQQNGTREMDPEELEGVRNFEKRSRWASEKFSEMEIEPPSRLPASKLLREFKKTGWMTEEDQERFREEQWERYKNVMEQGTHYSAAVGHERVREEALRRRPAEEKASPVRYAWADLLLWISLGVLVVSAVGLTRRRPSARKGSQMTEKEEKAWGRKVEADTL